MIFLCEPPVFTGGESAQSVQAKLEWGFSIMTRNHVRHSNRSPAQRGVGTNVLYQGTASQAAEKVRGESRLRLGIQKPNC